MDRLPLNALRAFEAAARHCSMSKAAEELHLTHGAISHQVRSLEELLGARLFERAGRRLILTAAGQDLSEAIGEAFRTLQEAMLRARRPGGNSLTISLVTSFAARWLAPRLPRFHARYPDIVVNMQMTKNLVDLRRDGVDLAVRIGSGNYPGLACEKLMDETIFPVASPHLAGGLPKVPAELSRYLLLGDQNRPGDSAKVVVPEEVRLHLTWDYWPLWCNAAGMDYRTLRFSASIEDSGVLLDMAIAGQAIVLARSALVAGDLQSERLVRLFDVAVPSPFSYWVVTLPYRREEPAIAAFRTWLHEEAAIFTGGQTCAPARS